MIFRPFGAEKGDLDYILRNSSAVILTGDPATFRRLRNGIDFSQKVFSGVLRFEESLVEENAQTAGSPLTMRRLRRILRHFRRVLAINGDRSRTYWLLVMHSDKGGTEVHCIGLQVDLRTEKSHTIYLKQRDQYRLRRWQSVINSTYGLSDPNDGRRQLKAEPNPRSPQWGLRKTITDRVREYFKTRDQGHFEDTVSFVRSLGHEVSLTYDGRPRRNLAVVTDQGNLVLRGVYFKRDFDLNQLREWKPPKLEEIYPILAKQIERFDKLTAKRFSIPETRLSSADRPTDQVRETVRRKAAEFHDRCSGQRP